MNTMNLTIGLVLVAATAAPIAAINPQQTATPTTASAEVTQCAQAQMVVDRLLAGAMARMETARQANTAADLRAAIDSLQNTLRDVRAQLASCSAAQAAGNAQMDHSKMSMGTAPAAAAAPAPATSAGPAASAPMDHSKMPMGPTPAKPVTAGTAKAPGAKPAVSPASMDHSKMPMGNAPAAKPAPGIKSAPGAKPAPSAPMDHSKMAMAATADTSTQATDPVCGLKVDPAMAPHANHEGKSYSFCSEQHRELFQKNPAKYLPKGK